MVIITVGLFLKLVGLAFLCEFIDASVGMGYGTILCPVLIIMGFDPHVVVPAILLSQAVGGLSASIFHHQFKNVSFKQSSPHLKAVLLIAGFGVVATVLGAVISVSLSKTVLKGYIGFLVLGIGVMLLCNLTFRFSWKAVIGLGIFSAFNKGFSGGGFGPIITGGQVIIGQQQKAAVGITTLAEAPICVVGFFTYFITRMFHQFGNRLLEMPFSEFMLNFFSQMYPWELWFALFLGSLSVAPFAAITTKLVLTGRRANRILGVFITILGVWTLMETL